jgi:glycerol-3-phosphate dehydrogenase
MSMFPGIKADHLTGGAVFCDGQMFNPPRLAISFIRSAIDRGAVGANYVEAGGFLRDGNRVLGIAAKDLLADEPLQIRARCVLNAAGPWAHRLLEQCLGIQMSNRPTFSRDLAFVVNRPFQQGHGLAFSAESMDSDTIMDRGGRHLFAVSWRNYTLIGVWHVVFHEPPEKIEVDRKVIQGYIDEVNVAYPGISLRMDEVNLINTGLTLFGEEGRQGDAVMSFGKRSTLIDHEDAHQLQGLVTLIGVRATTGRGMAEKAINLILGKLGIRGDKCMTETTPIFGGEFDSFEELLDDAVRKYSSDIPKQQIIDLVHDYGSEYRSVLNYLEERPDLEDAVDDSAVLGAEIVHAVREEMAKHLSDVVYRRTGLGTGKIPPRRVLRQCAQVMADEIDWQAAQIEDEIESALSAFPLMQ